MGTNNGNTTIIIRGYQIEVFKILDSYEKIDYNICFLKIKSSQITRGHDFMLVNDQRRWDVTDILSPRRPSIYGIYDRLIVCTLVILICSRTD